MAIELLKGRGRTTKMLISITVSALMVALGYNMTFYSPTMYMFFPILSAMFLCLVPYVLGLTGIRRFMKIGIVALIISGVLFATVDSYHLREISRSSEWESEGGELTVTVDPSQNDGGATFRFTATYTGGETGNLTLHLWEDAEWAEYNMTEIDPGDTDASDGKGYELERYLDTGIYQYYCSMEINASEDVIETKEGVGPVAASFGTYFPLFLINGIVLALVYVGFPFLFLMFMYYFIRKMRRGREAATQSTRGKDKKGAAGSGDEDEEEAEDEGAAEEGGEEESGSGYICSDCGRDVAEDDTVCPHCGEPLE